MDNFRRLRILARGATILGSDLLTLCTGTRNQQDMWTYHPQNQSPAAWRAMIEAMWQAVEIAAEFGLKLGIEPEVANVVSNANDAARLMAELGSYRIKIVFDPANLYRPPADPRTDHSVITDALTLLGNHIAIAHCKDIAAPAAKEPGCHQEEPLYAHLAAGEGILNYRYYLSELKRLAPARVPLILHGLKEEQIPRAVAFIRNCMSELEASTNSITG